jgi:peptide methionine sulfoxide reductase MsrA
MLYTLHNMKYLPFFSKTLSTFILFFSCVAFWTTHTPLTLAQGVSGVTQAYIETNPQNPTPDETVTASINTYTVDMDTALVTWKLNGQTVLQGYSESQYEFKVGEVGETYTLSVYIEDGNGKKVSANTTIHVSDATIIWEAKTYTPPFYKGRALQSPGSEITIAVLPHVVDSKGNEYKKEDLSYVWRFGKSIKIEQSGKGKHSISITNPKPFELFSAYVEVKDPQGNIRVGKKVEVPTVAPILLLYQDTPYVGIEYASALTSTFVMPENDATIIAEPYYMSTDTRIGTNLEYLWTMDLETFTTPGSISFGSEGNGTGSSKLSLLIKNKDFWLQNGRFDTVVQFGLRNQWGSTNPETPIL